MRFRTLTALTAVPALSAGLLAVAGPAAHAAVITNTVTFNHSCAPDTGWLGSGALRSITDSLTITAPDAVEVGQEFTITMQPGEMISDANPENRIKYDLAVPAGAELVSYSIVPDSATGFDTKSPASAPGVTRIDAAGKQSATGTFLRISGDGQVVYNGESGKTNDGEYTKGARVATASSQFRLPAVTMTLRAPTEPGQVTTGIRTGAETPAKKVAETSYSSLVNNGFLKNTAWYCTAQGAGRSALSTTSVQKFSDTTTAVDVQLEALTGDEVAIKATVDPHPGAGTVDFYSNDVKIGSGTVGDDGVAQMTTHFRDLGKYAITAKYVGAPGFRPSESTPKDVTVTVPGEVIVVPPQPEEPSTGAAGSLGTVLQNPAFGSLGELVKNPAMGSLKDMMAGG